MFAFHVIFILCQKEKGEGSRCGNRARTQVV